MKTEQQRQPPPPPPPGAILLSPIAIASVVLVVFNDFYLKRHDPGLLSGKLSDVGLLIFLPLFIVASFEWMLAGVRFITALARTDRMNSLGSSERFVLGMRIVGCVAAALYFGAIKSSPWATHAHEAWLSFVMPRWHFHAVTDPTDLLCLPAVLIAWFAMVRTNVLTPARPHGAKDLSEEHARHLA